MFVRSLPPVGETIGVDGGPAAEYPSLTAALAALELPTEAFRLSDALRVSDSLRLNDAFRSSDAARAAASARFGSVTSVMSDNGRIA